MKWMSLVAAAVVVGASAMPALAAGQKIILDVDGVGIVKIKPVCEGGASALEVEVELQGALPLATCTATVEALGVMETLEPFETDDEGEGEVKADVLVTDPPVGEDVTVTVTIVCNDGETEVTHVVEGVVVFVKSCSDDNGPGNGGGGNGGGPPSFVLEFLEALFAWLETRPRPR